MANIVDPISGLAIDLPKAGSRTILRSLHAQLRGAILDGRLKAGLRLPATRILADGLGVSRNTAIAAYDLLLSEGYISTRRGSGAFVSDIARRVHARPAKFNEGGDRRLAPMWRGVKPKSAAAGFGRANRYDLKLGLPDKSLFPFDVWRRLSARALRSLSAKPAAYGAAAGRPALREAIARHVSFARAVACEAEDVVVVNGAQQAFDLLARILVTPGRTIVAVEEPGYPPMRTAFVQAGAKLAPVHIDDEGLRVDLLPSQARVIIVTPSHQFPLGVAMSAARRAALLDFASAHNAVVIEDDYDGEFRFSGHAIDALQTLDRQESVLYVGTFSKSLFPALRLGFVVAPAWAREPLIAAKHATDWHAALLAQDTLAAFISEGHLARHVRKMRGVYSERHRALRASLERRCGSWLKLAPSDVGLHLAGRITGAFDAAQLAERAAHFDVGLNTLREFALRRTSLNGVAFGYGLLDAADMDIAARRLADAAEGLS